MLNLDAQQNSEDYLVRAVALDGQIRAFAGQTTSLAEEARQRHGTWPTATAALGRTLTAGLLLALDLKGDNALTIRVMGDGPLGAIVVTADAAGGVRGYVQEPQVLLPSRSGKLDVGGAVGSNGSLYISKDLGMKEPYVGSVPLVSGEIAEDITYYLAASEQIPAVTALGVSVDTDGKVLAAGGYIIQVMPGAEESTIAYLVRTGQPGGAGNQFIYGRAFSGRNPKRSTWVGSEAESPGPPKSRLQVSLFPGAVKGYLDFPGTEGTGGDFAGTGRG